MAPGNRALRADARRNRDAILDAASELFATKGEGVQMDDIAARAGLGVGTLYRHFADKQSLNAAIIGRRFDDVTRLAEAASDLEDPLAAFQAVLLGYLEAAEADIAFRRALLGSDTPAWETIDDQKRALTAVVAAVVERAVAAGRLRADFTADDFVLVARGAMANMGDRAAWRRHLSLQFEGIAGSLP
jgi:AcrR family transcriptional regulator